MRYNSLFFTDMTNAIFAFLIVVLVFGGAYFWLRDRGSSSYAVQTKSAQEKSVSATGSAAEGKPVATDGKAASAAPETSTAPVTELKIETLKEGSGPAAKKGDSVSVQYMGTLLDGTKFDSSYDRGEPFTFTLGAGSVIKGWDEGLVGMKVGEKRKLTIPADMAYGSRSMGKIPANSPLVFEVELAGIK